MHGQKGQCLLGLRRRNNCVIQSPLLQESLVNSKHIVLLCKSEGDLADIRLLSSALLTNDHRITVVAESPGSIAQSTEVPPNIRVAQCIHEINDLVDAGIDAIVSSCPKGGITLLRALCNRLQNVPVFILPDARKVRFRDLIRHLGAHRVFLLANDSSVPHVGSKERVLVGLPRFDSLVNMNDRDRTIRRATTRSLDQHSTPEDFVVLFLGQEHETARVLHDLVTALRGIPARQCDRPINRVLGIQPHKTMHESETALWHDALALRSSSTPNLRVLDNIERTMRDATSRRTCTELTIVDAILAADLVVSSTHSGLITAAVLGIKSLSYFAPGIGETSYRAEIAGYVESWGFLPDPHCIRRAQNYTQLRNAIISAIPSWNADGTINHPRWPEQDAARNAPWTQGSNTDNCVQAIERVLAQ